MKKIRIFCTSLNYYKIIDKLPKYIIPLGLGNKSFPPHWLDEKKGKNISHLNSYYGELTGIYWIWKNKLQDMEPNDLIGNCHYRKLWLNKLYVNKQKFSISNLYSKLLNNNISLNNSDCIQVQPIIFKNKNLLEDFKEVHNTDIIENCIDFLNDETKSKFFEHLNQNKLFPLNMFITKKKIFEKYCEEIFPWLEKCLNLLEKKNLCKNYNQRLPAFLSERFTSFWFSQFNNKSYLSYARLGNLFLSNKINHFTNPLKIPFTFRMYPTLHRY